MLSSSIPCPNSIQIISLRNHAAVAVAPALFIRVMQHHRPLRQLLQGRRAKQVPFQCWMPKLKNPPASTSPRFFRSHRAEYGLRRRRRKKANNKKASFSRHKSATSAAAAGYCDLTAFRSVCMPTYTVSSSSTRYASCNSNVCLLCRIRSPLFETREEREGENKDQEFKKPVAMNYRML